MEKLKMDLNKKMLSVEKEIETQKDFNQNGNVKFKVITKIDENTTQHKNLELNVFENNILSKDILGILKTCDVNKTSDFKISNYIKNKSKRFIKENMLN